MSNLPKVGETFELEVPWPESFRQAQRALGVYSLPSHIKVRREPDLTDEEVEEQRATGKLKQFYQIAQFDKHHVVSFAGERWVYDFLGRDVTFTGGFILPPGEN